MPTSQEIKTQYDRWTKQMHDQAEKQGWNMFNYDSMGLLQLQRIDEAEVFDDDLAAIEFVKQQAAQGDATAIVALELDAFFDPLIYPEKRETNDVSTKPKL